MRGRTSKNPNMAGMACFNVVCYFVVFLSVTYAFNVDSHAPIVKEGRIGAYFGFSVTQHQIYQHSTDSIKHVILVGAPRDNVTDSSADSSIKNLKSPGVVYSCPVSSFMDDCKAVEIDREAPRSGEVKDGQWLGVSVQSQGSEEGKAVACAHRFRMTGPGYDYGPGLCFVMSNELDEDGFLEPCSGKPNKDGHGQYGLCQAGTSLDVSEDGDVLIGTPGPYNWRGASFKNIIRDSLTEFPRWYQSPVENLLNEDDNRPEPAVGYYSYLGMSSKIGNILDGQKTYVAGAPRSKNVGEVLLFKQSSSYLTVEPTHRLLGEQFGSGFGYDMAIIDLDGANGKDLVIGAPFYHQMGVGGVIYVYMNDGTGITEDTKPIMIKSRKMKESECKDLDCSNSRFGFSLANIGDIDLDGFEDLAVGAPFEGTGAVYIFRGSEKGIQEEYSQRIAAVDLLSARPLSSFGYSLSAGKDMDNNGYPDIVVGAYNNDKALILRTRPVINVEAIMTVDGPQRIDPSTLCEDGKNQICFDLKVCFKFEAKPLDKFLDKQDIEYKIVAETFTGKTKSRASFKGATPGQTHMIERSIKLLEQTRPESKCRQHVVYIEKNNKDFLNPIFFELTYKLKDRGVPTMRPGDILPDINNYPVLNEQAARQELGVEFEKDCGVDSICQSDLRVSGDIKLDIDESNMPVLRAGEEAEVLLNIRVMNLGEDAHEATLDVLLPKTLPFLNSVPRIGCVFTVLEDDPEFNKVMCPMGNPMKEGEEKSVDFRLNAKKIVTAEDNIVKIKLSVNTTSTEVEDLNNMDIISIRVLVETDFILQGLSVPSTVIYGGQVLGESAIKYEDEIGSMVVHKYVLTNDGSADVARSTLWIYWPYEVENGYAAGKHLLYLMEEPRISSPGKCMVEPPGQINPLGIKSPPQSEVVVNNGEDGQNPEYNTGENRRVKRENVISPEIQDINGKDQRIVHMDCESRSAKCFKIKCTIGEMLPESSISVTLRSRLWNHTLVEDYRNVDKVYISSMAWVEIDPALNIQQSDTTNDKAKATVVAIPGISIRDQQGVPIWVIILAVIGGLLLLILLIILLWKCGFFKRKKPEDVYVAEKKKMNYYEDDYS